MRARLPVLDTTTGTPEQAEALLEWGRDRGQTSKPGDIWGMLVVSPEGMRRVGKLGAFARVGTGLPKLVREAAVFVAVYARGFDYEIALHEKNILSLGESPDFIEKLRQGKTDGLPDGVREAVHLSQAMIASREVPQDTFDAVKAALGETGLVELSITIAYFLMLSDLAHVFWPAE